MRVDFWLQAVTNILSVIIGLLLGAALAGTGSWGDWVSQWQTLLAGSSRSAQR